MILKLNLNWLLRGWLMSAITSYKLKLGVELGTYMGWSTFFMLDYAPDLVLHTVDIFEQQPAHENYKEDSYDFTDRYPKVVEKAKKYGDRLTIHKGWTHEVVEKFEDSTLDFVFVDADHTYEGCKRDILLWRPKIRKGGVLMGHDTHKKGVEKAVNECCKDFTAVHGAFCWIEQL